MSDVAPSHHHDHDHGHEIHGPIATVHWWRVHAPPRPIYRNGLRVYGDALADSVILPNSSPPRGPGPHVDPGFPFFPGGRVGRPRALPIKFDGFWLGGNGHALEETPETGLLPEQDDDEEEDDDDDNGDSGDSGDSGDTGGGQPAMSPLAASAPAPTAKRRSRSKK